MTDEQIGRTIRAALNYCESGSTPDLQALDKIEQASFKRLCNNIDEAAESYRARSKAGQENGKQGGRGNKKYKTMPDDETERLRKDILSQANLYKANETSVYKGYKQDKIEMRGDRAEMSDFPLYLNTVAGGLDRRDQTIGGFSFVVKIYAVPVVEIIG